ncbi:DNA annealing helicase and endonuclease ZRANB3 [Cajanus cajan]|uniref:DNA annealing helicase and endonuclease ZRANB3 n=1 Tax=Cajanus cajan TaxID=3821 RepID=UPI00098DBC97|nr:DNA annealing helicase and endonuclease ZRANB3 [Cajanus cajan]
MELSEEQLQQVEANRAAAMAKRKAFLESKAKQQPQRENTTNNNNPWHLFKCQKLPLSPKPQPPKFLARLQICSPDSFSVTPLPLPNFPFPGHQHSLATLTNILSHVTPSHFTQTAEGAKACVFHLADYRHVLRPLKAAAEALQVEEIPWATFNVVERLSHSFAAGRWTPLLPEHLPEDEVERLVAKLPATLRAALLPFQHDGLRFALRRGARCLIADDMGLGKTLQGIAVAGCFMDEGPVLVVCPAVLRYSWAEELERWLPFCLPADIHLVFGHLDNPVYLTRSPKVVVISYTMLHRLRKSMLEREWALLIVDESHHVRCTKKTEPGEIKAVLDVASKVKRIILLSGTPSLSRPYDIYNQINMLWPGLLGKTKYEFAKTYCDLKYMKGIQGKYFADYSKGVRLEELNVLLKQTVMIRRLKEHVLLQLPPKRRQIIRLLLKRSDIVAAKTAVGVLNIDASERASEDMSLENLDEPDGKLSYQELGIAKLSGFREWLALHPIIEGSENASKMIIFAHHHKVLDGVQEFICEKGTSFVRIDGNTLARDRQSAVVSFRSSPEVKIAIIGILAAGFGLDFSTAQDVVFLELPQCPTLMLQAEDRAHRRGQTNAVNVYIFCAKDTLDESHWKNLNKSLQRVSCTTDGKYDAKKEIEVEGISYLDSSLKIDNCEEQSSCKDALGETQLATQPSEVNPNESEANQNDKTDEGTCVNNSTQSSNIMVDNVSCQDLGKASGLDGTCGVDVFDAVEGFQKCFEDKEQLKDMKSVSTTEADDDQSVHPVETDGHCSNQVDFLRFEVSPYTGRIHLYTCILGTDERPQPLHENFRPEELELLSSVADDEKQAHDENQKIESVSVKENPAYRSTLLAFAEEWKNLRSIERRKLLGKPLQLPLAVELCYLSESNNHNNKGLLNGGSRRRKTPLMEISCPLPSDAVWRKVYLRNGISKKEKEYTQGWSLTDEPLCKLCQKQCLENNARTPEYFEDLFCSLVCYEEYRMRTSNRYLREELFKIEHGVCTNCQLDCHKLVEYIRPLSLERRREYIEKVAPNVAKRKSMLEKLLNEPTEGNAWHADHIVPVYQGGGECKLENLRTLCVACHYDVTAAQCAERRIARAKARKQLKALMNSMKNDIKSAASSKIKDCRRLEDKEGNMPEDELLVEVPGSAYSLADS